MLDNATTTREAEIAALVAAVSEGVQALNPEAQRAAAMGAADNPNPDTSLLHETLALASFERLTGLADAGVEKQPAPEDLMPGM